MENNPTFEIEKLVQDMLQNVHTCIPGKIESFDADKCLAVVMPTGQFIAPSGEKIDFPKVHDVPVVIQQYAGQDITMAFPIREGDGCMLHFSEQQLDRFRDEEEAKCDLRHDITNAIAVVGLFRQANKVVKEACDDDAVIIDHNEDSRVIIKKDEQLYQVTDGSTVLIKADSQECKVGSATLTIKSSEITAKVATFKIDGKLEVTQTIDADSNIISKAKVTGRAGVDGATASLDTHTHIGNLGAPTAPPTPGT